MSSDTPLDWAALDSLPEKDFRLLVESAVGVLQGGADPESLPYADEVTAMPPPAVAAELQSALAGNKVDASRDQIEPLLTSRPLATLVLREMAKEPELRSAIEQAYVERQKLLVIEGGVLLAGALLILAIKIKRFKAGSGEVDVTFGELQQGVLGEVRSFLGL